MKDQYIKEELLQLIVETGIAMVKTGMTVGTWGNISCRDAENDLMYISPSGMDYEIVRPQHVVVLDLQLNVVAGTAEPSVEKHMHAAVYRARRDINAVVHTHPVYSSAFGVARKELPAVSEDFAQIIGASVRYCEHYELPGTPELGREAVSALGENNAVLLPNHGALAVGADMAMALKVSRVLEKNAHIYLLAQSIGTPHTFDPEDIAAMQNFVKRSYGKRNAEQFRSK